MRKYVIFVGRIITQHKLVNSVTSCFF